MKGLSAQMLETLHIVRDNEGIGATQIAEMREVARAGQHQILNRLERRGLIETRVFARGESRPVRACYIADNATIPETLEEKPMFRSTGPLTVAEKLMARLSAEPIGMEDFVDILAERGIITSPQDVLRELRPHVAEKRVERATWMDGRRMRAGYRLTYVGEMYLEERWKEQDAA